MRASASIVRPPASTHLPQQCNRRHRKSRHQRCAPDSDSMHGAKTIRTYRSAVARHARAGPPSEARPSVATFRRDLPLLTNEMLVHGVRVHTKAGAQPGALFQRNFSPGLRHRHHPPEQRNNAPILLEPLFIHDQNIMDRIRDCV